MRRPPYVAYGVMVTSGLKNLPRCDVCGASGFVTVSSLPGIAASMARCAGCREAEAIPLGIAVANTATVGGLEHAAEWWKEAVRDTLLHLEMSQEDFEGQVEEAIAFGDLEPPVAGLEELPLRLVEE